jgi:3-methyladenine DNA glycosylase AlkC
MAEAFKNLIGPETVQAVSHHLRRVHPRFDQGGFEALALRGLDALEFKARAQHLAAALAAHLPTDFEACADVLVASLKRVEAPRFEHDPDKELGDLRTDDTGVGGWALWAYGEVIAQKGLHQPEPALAALHAITQRFTAEFAIRPFIHAHPQRVMPILQGWLDDPSAHVRRLVSEGSRPRLPWGLRLKALVQDPTPTLPWLQRLQDDPTEYVRRSVANHLNDIGKDHPELLVQWVRQHRENASPARTRLLRHASRHLIKQGHPEMLSSWGVGEAFRGQVTLSVPSQTVQIGESLPLRILLESAGDAPQALEVDVRVHYRKADGQLRPKVFKGRQLSLAPGEQRSWTQQISFKPVSTRALYPGAQGLDVTVNGQPLGWLDLMLSD